MVSDIFAMPSNRKKQSNMKNVSVKNTFSKTSNVNTTIALSTYSTPHPLSTSQKNEIYCFDSLNYCLRHWAAVWFVNRPFTASHSRGTKPPRLRAKVTLGQDKQKIYIIWHGNFICLSCPSASFALQHGGFVPREWLAAKGLLLLSVIIEQICGHRITRCCLFVC